MFNRLKKFISLLLCAALLNACVLPSATIFAARPSITKKQAKPVAPKAEEKEDSDEENPTISESWQKVVNLEWKDLTKADGWNIVKSAGGSLFTLAVAYKIFKSTSATDTSPIIDPTNNMPGDQPLINIKNDPISKSDQTIPLINELDKKIKKETAPITIKEKEKPQSLYPFADQAQKQMVPVVKQRGASCGYHSMLNAVLSVRGISENQAHEIINITFAQKDGIWRASIVQNRKKDLVKNYIYQLIHSCMILNTEEEQTAWNTAKAEWDTTISGSFGWFYRIIYSAPRKPRRRLSNDEREALNNISQAYVDAYLLDENLNILQENIENIPAQLENILVQHCLKIRSLCHPDDNKQLTYLDTCRACINIIDFAELATKIAPAHTFIETACVYATGSNLETDLYGDNLNTQEMESLNEIASQEAGTANSITVVDNTHLLNTEAYQGILTTAKEQMRLNDCIHSFCVRTRINSAYNHQEVEQLTKTLDDANASPETKNKAELRLDTINDQLHADTGSTHWITVTLDRKNGQNTYLIKDSMGGNYTNHIVVKQLIDALEQPNGPQLKHEEDFDVINDEETSNNNSIADNTATNNIAQALTNALNNISNKSNSKKNSASTSKKITRTNSQKEINAIRPTALIPTLEQTDNSCGYHALKNGDDLLDILKKPVIEILHSFEEIITRIGNTLCCPKSTEKVINLFDEVNNTGTWREIIRKERAIPVLKICIKEKLLKSVPLTTAQQIAWNDASEKYETDFTIWNNERIKWGKESLKDYLQFYPKPEKLNKPRSGNINKLIEQDFNDIAHACAKQLSENDEPIVLGEKSILHELLVNIVQKNSPSILIRENYNQCTEILNADELKNNFGDAMTIETLLKNAPNENELKTVINLSDEELQLLLISENDRTLKHADDISIITSREEPEFVSEVLPFIKAKMKSPRCLHAFIMRSGFSIAINNFCDEKNQSNNGTHWICVVLCRINNENYYIVTDSFKGDIFTAQITADVRTLIAILES